MTALRIVAEVPATLMHEFFSASDLDRLEALAGPPGAFVRVDARDEVADLSQVEAVITSWSSAPFTSETLSRMHGLRLIAHTGATIRPFVTDALLDSEVCVTQAGLGMARSVAEVSLAFTMALLHRIPQMNDAVRREDGWFAQPTIGAQHEILGAPIAVVGASRTGRAYLEMVRMLGAEALLVDPMIDGNEASALGAELLPLDEALVRAQIVALHAPSLPSTRHMIGARELALLADGASLVNTARSWLVDEAALVAEVRSGRISAAVDVFDEEPLPVDSPFRTLPGLLLTPHRAAGTVEGRLRQGRIVVDEIENFFGGCGLRHAVGRAQLAFMA